MRYWPLPSVTAVRTFSISTGLAASTVTPGRTAPDASFTTPAIDACAKADSGRARTIDRTSRIRRDVRMQKTPLAGPTGRLNEVPRSPVFDFLEVDLCTHLDEARLQHRRRRQPVAVGHERLIVGEHSRAVQNVVEIDTDVRLHAAERQDLRKTQIDLVDAIAIQGTRRNQIDRRGRRAVREAAPERRRDERVRRGPVRGERIAL